MPWLITSSNCWELFPFFSSRRYFMLLKLFRDLLIINNTNAMRERFILAPRHTCKRRLLLRFCSERCLRRPGQHISIHHEGLGLLVMADLSDEAVSERKPELDNASARI